MDYLKEIGVHKPTSPNRLAIYEHINQMARTRGLDYGTLRKAVVAFQHTRESVTLGQFKIELAEYLKTGKHPRVCPVVEVSL